MALTSILNECIRGLGYKSVSQKAWISEREMAISVLRGLCEYFGDNDWDTDLHLADIIDKHLGNYLHEND